MFYPVIRATILEALRSRLLWLVLAVLVAAAGVAAFLQQVAIIEVREMQATIIAALLRACAVFLLVAFVVMSMVREYSDKVLELMLAQPFPRSHYLLGKFVGFAVAALVIAALTALPLVAWAPLGRVALWSLSLFCELAILAAMSLFCVLTLTHVVPALAAVFAFYVLARSIAAAQVIARATESAGAWTDRLADAVISGIGYLLPRMDLMTQTGWLTEAAPSASVVAGIVTQTLLYTALLLAAALFDFHRQNL